MNAWIKTSDRMPDACVPVIVFVQIIGAGTRRIRAQYAGEKTLALSDQCDGGVYDEATDEYYCEPGWYETNEWEDIHWSVEGEVTHWMPLPDPPGDEALVNLLQEIEK